MLGPAAIGRTEPSSLKAGRTLVNPSASARKALRRVRRLAEQTVLLSVRSWRCMRRSARRRRSVRRRVGRSFRRSAAFPPGIDGASGRPIRQSPPSTPSAAEQALQGLSESGRHAAYDIQARDARREEPAKTAWIRISGKSDDGSEIQKRNRGVNRKSASRLICSAYASFDYDSLQTGYSTHPFGASQSAETPKKERGGIAVSDNPSPP